MVAGRTRPTGRLDLRCAPADAFARFTYPTEIGPGVYDIHSPRVPSDEDMIALLRRATTDVCICAACVTRYTEQRANGADTDDE